MDKRVTCFLYYKVYTNCEETVSFLLHSSETAEVYLLTEDEVELKDNLQGCKILKCVPNMNETTVLRTIQAHATTPYLLLYTQTDGIQMGYHALERMCDYMQDNQTGMVYADHDQTTNGTRNHHPVTDYQWGSVRDDFDFGPVVMYRKEAFDYGMNWLNNQEEYHYSALYALRLAISRMYELTHIHEYLYMATEHDNRKSGEKQFDYVDPRNRQVQIEREQVCTLHLEEIGAKLPKITKRITFEEEDFEYEASVIIPVKNRARTIDDAIHSVLKQKTDFKFNLIIIDNHSTDGTSEIIDQYINDARIIHLIPEATDLGIGGCWNTGIDHPKCGRFAVQLDSDDLYSDEFTLQTIVNKFYSEGCAMVIGSYRMTDFNLNPLPPGVIDHKEWSDENGHNNALRINGLGAPRAFFTPLLRDIRVPNTSYGEDYALGLAFSRNYHIGRIYDVLYLCRRWEGNSDAALGIEKVNDNNSYKDSLRTLEIKRRQQMEHPIYLAADDFFKKQLEQWDLARKNHEALKNIKVREMDIDGYKIQVQFNPARSVSSFAKTDKASIEKRPCFLCQANKPEEQLQIPIKLDEKFMLRINPYPIVPGHIVITSVKHEPQRLLGKESQHLPERLLNWMENNFAQGYALFYNGAQCGASAPDHFHFQGAPKQYIPLLAKVEKMIERKEEERKEELKKMGLESEEKHKSQMYMLSDYIFDIFVNIIDKGYEFEPSKIVNQINLFADDTNMPEMMLNLFAWNTDNGKTAIAVIYRKKHRPDRYFAQDDSQMLISPGALDMGGIIVTARQEDFDRITADDVKAIYQEVAYCSK